MFSNKLVMALFLFGSFEYSVDAFSKALQPLVKSERNRIELANVVLSPRQSSSLSYSSISQTQVSSFISSWQSLSQSFSECQSVFSERQSITVATQSVQRLYTSYQAAVTQYSSCSACSSYLSQSSYTSLIQTSVTQMYSSFQSIITTCQQNYGEQWQSQFSSVFQSMSEFGSFSRQVCTSAGVDLSSLLVNVGINVDIFSTLGINVGINLGLGVGSGGLVGGLVGGILGGQGGHGLLG